jgi:hypothetical protein
LEEIVSVDLIEDLHKQKPGRYVLVSKCITIKKSGGRHQYILDKEMDYR